MARISQIRKSQGAIGLLERAADLDPDTLSRQYGPVVPSAALSTYSYFPEPIIELRAGPLVGWPVVEARPTVRCDLIPCGHMHPVVICELYRVSFQRKVDRFKV